MFKQMIDSLIYVFLNYFVCNIPSWTVRKIMYMIMGMKIGKNSRILMKTTIVCPWRIEIGDNTYINEYCFLDGRGGLKIGSNVTIAIYSKLITGYHNIDDEQFSYSKKSIMIEDECAVFAGCIVLGGAHICRGGVLTAGSVAKSGEYMPYGIFAGNPIMHIRNREVKEKISQSKWKPFFR